MSEFINNRAKRQEKLKEVIKKLHDGASVEEVRDEFDQLTINVSPTEITQMEQALVDEGMPVSDIQRLCDVHASVFKGAIEDIHKEVADIPEPSVADWHPIDTFKRENRLIEKLLEEQVLPKLVRYTNHVNDKNKTSLAEAIETLLTIDKHYSRKENLLFPYMEKYDITAPPQVMWGVDDEIRDEIKGVKADLKKADVDIAALTIRVEAVVERTHEMIFKEEQIMFPMVADTFTLQEWADIEKASAEIGFMLLTDIGRWTPQVSDVAAKAQAKPSIKPVVGTVGKDTQTTINFDAGALTSEEVNAILNTVPLDMTFVGADDRVKYFTQGKERVFERPLTIIGREVKHCHPPKSVHIVEQIVKDLRAGKKESEDFWIKMGDAFVYIRYFAVRSKKGEFLGVLEVTQNIKPITELEGEKRLMS